MGGCCLVYGSDCWIGWQTGLGGLATNKLHQDTKIEWRTNKDKDTGERETKVEQEKEKNG